jgi:hypothetical protein
MEINTATAADGGSLWLGFGEFSQGQGYFLNRSIVARGTPAYEQISDEQGVLSREGLRDLLDKLLSIRDAMTREDPNFETVNEFLGVLQRQAPEEA